MASRTFDGISPASVKVGQRWGLWTFDDSLYERFTVTNISDGTVHGTTDDGNPCIVGVARLVASGDPI